LVAYSNQGVYKSIRTAVKSKTRKRIIQARRMEGRCILASPTVEVPSRKMVLLRFDELMVDG
jgi:hypothetical protein